MIHQSPMSELTNSSRLTFPLALADGTTIETVAEAAAYFSELSLERRDDNHWKVAIRMLDIALREPTYLKTATMSLQTALILDGLLISPHPLEAH